MTPAARLAYALRVQLRHATERRDRVAEVLIRLRLARSEAPEVSRALDVSPRASGPSSPVPAVVAPLAAAGTPSAPGAAGAGR